MAGISRQHILRNYESRKDVTEEVVQRKPAAQGGTGKTQLAYEVADALKAPLITWHVKSTTKAMQGLYVGGGFPELYADQLAALEADSKRFGTQGHDLDFALVMDGLSAEREQGITIDVAYRFFATAQRRFIIADTPGHQQYTRNMVTGASTADLSIVLVDARKGVSEQTRRHAFIASLLRIPHLVVCVNKMDLVDYSEDVFYEIVYQMSDWTARLEIPDITFIPISALHGDNVVDRSVNMPWYGAATLLYHLEHVVIAPDRNLSEVRLPIQWVVRPMSDEHHDYRGYAGQVAGGVPGVGQPVGAVTVMEGKIPLSLVGLGLHSVRVVGLHVVVYLCPAPAVALSASAPCKRSILDTSRNPCRRTSKRAQQRANRVAPADRALFLDRDAHRIRPGPVKSR